MGYDVYDYFDVGEFDQKGGVPTWFGTKDELVELIRVSHENELQVYVDVVANHNSGADAEEYNPIDKAKHWTKFTPKSGQTNIFPFFS